MCNFSQKQYSIIWFAGRTYTLATDITYSYTMTEISQNIMGFMSYFQSHVPNNCSLEILVIKYHAFRESENVYPQDCNPISIKMYLYCKQRGSIKPLDSPPRIQFSNIIILCSLPTPLARAKHQWYYEHNWGYLLRIAF